MDVVWIGETAAAEATLLALSFVLSAVIGIERHRRTKSAGLRTHVLVGIGTATFTLVSAYGFAGGSGPASIVDPTRVAAQVVSGIGFLGAGVIFVRRGSVSGLTTAASIWVTASVGMACGAGAPLLAVMTTALYLVAVTALPLLASRVRQHQRNHSLLLRYVEGVGALRLTLAAIASSGLESTVVRAVSPGSARGSALIEATIVVRGADPQLVELLLDRIAEIDGVRSVRTGEADDG
jgi:putative Mg2+ transporter-C (MgtC) family protein